MTFLNQQGFGSMTESSDLSYILKLFDYYSIIFLVFDSSPKLNFFIPDFNFEILVY